MRFEEEEIQSFAEKLQQRWSS